MRNGGSGSGEGRPLLWSPPNDDDDDNHRRRGSGASPQHEDNDDLFLTPPMDLHAAAATTASGLDDDDDRPYPHHHHHHHHHRQQQQHLHGAICMPQLQQPPTSPWAMASTTPMTTVPHFAPLSSRATSPSRATYVSVGGAVAGNGLRRVRSKSLGAEVEAYRSSYGTGDDALLVNQGGSWHGGGEDDIDDREQQKAEGGFQTLLVPKLSDPVGGGIFRPPIQRQQQQLVEKSLQHSSISLPRRKHGGEESDIDVDSDTGMSIPGPERTGQQLYRESSSYSTSVGSKEKEESIENPAWICVMYGLINATIVLPVLMSFGSIIYRDQAFAPYMPVLVKLTLVSGIVHQLCFSTFSTLPFAVGQVQDAGLIFLSSMASFIVQYCKDYDDVSMLATVTVGLSLCTALLGVGLVLVGYLKLAQYVQRLPTW